MNRFFIVNNFKKLSASKKFQDITLGNMAINERSSKKRKGERRKLQFSLGEWI